MKHLKKIFESTKKDQLEEVEDIFQELVDNKTLDDEGEEYSDCEIYDEKDSIIRVYIGNYIPEILINSTSDYENFIKSSEERIESIKSLKKYLQRLDYSGFTWDMNIDDDQGYWINIQYKEAKLSLVDVFGGEFGNGRINNNIAKRVFKEKYNLNFTGSTYREATTGYYGKRAVCFLRFKETILPNSKIVKDLEKVEQKYKYYSTAEEGEQVTGEKVVYSLEIIDNRIKLEMR